MRFNLFALQQQLELKLGRNVSWAEIAKETGLHYNTVFRLGNNKATVADLETLSRLATYFHRHGLAVGVQDLIVMETA